MRWRCINWRRLLRRVIYRLMPGSMVNLLKFQVIQIIDNTIAVDILDYVSFNPSCGVNYVRT